MNLRNKVMLLLLLSGFFSCSTTTFQSSSGFSINGQSLPPGVPSIVGVPIFSGDSYISTQATDQFSAGLMQLGFEVVERAHLEEIINERKLQYSGLVAESSRGILNEELGLQGLFVGSVTGESSAAWVDTHFNVKLIDISSGKTIWSATTKDPRAITLSMDVRTSIVHTVNSALSVLRKDINKLRK